jgi:hypothetical protein
MKLGRSVILILVLTLAGTYWGLPGLEAVPQSAATTNPSSQSSPKPVRGTAASAHRTRTHTRGSQTTKTASHSRHPSKLSRASQKSGHKSTRHKVAVHRSTAYTRLAHMQMDPARVENIQQALINAGDLHGTPTGRWDTATRDAMARYQTANGFGATGLPDAKSLMKLGLGPHPLPPQLDKSRTPPSNLSTGDAGAVPSNPARVAPAAPAPAEPPSAAPPATTDPPLKRSALGGTAR